MFPYTAQETYCMPIFTFLGEVGVAGRCQSVSQSLSNGKNVVPIYTDRLNSFSTAFSSRSYWRCD